jgi:hypothetical protein
MPLKIARTALLVSALVYAACLITVPAFRMLGISDSPMAFQWLGLARIFGIWAAIAMGLSAAACVLIQIISTLWKRGYLSPKSN